MSDTGDSTLRSAEQALGRFLTQAETAQEVPSEAELRDKAQVLAMGVAYAWTTRDLPAQETFLDELVKLPHELGVTFAVELFTHIRMFSLQPGSLRPGTEVATMWVPTELPGVHPSVAANEAPSGRRSAPQHECIEIINGLWSGLGSGDHARVTLSRARMARLSQPQLREVLRIMAYDVYRAMDQFAGWQGLGAEALDGYRRTNPADYEVGAATETDP